MLSFASGSLLPAAAGSSSFSCGESLEGWGGGGVLGWETHLHILRAYIIKKQTSSRKFALSESSRIITAQIGSRRRNQGGHVISLLLLIIMRHHNNHHHG